MHPFLTGKQRGGVSKGHLCLYVSLIFRYFLPVSIYISFCLSSPLVSPPSVHPFSPLFLVKPYDPFVPYNYDLLSHFHFVVASSMQTHFLAPAVLSTRYHMNFSASSFHSDYLFPPSGYLPSSFPPTFLPPHPLTGCFHL